jgi:hypothetical protein
MNPHAQKLLTRLREQHASQSSQLREVFCALENLDSRAQIPVSDELLREFEAACSERVFIASAVPMRGMRA